MAELAAVEIRVRRARLSRAFVHLACLSWRLKVRGLTGWLFRLAEGVLVVESRAGGCWRREVKP